MPSRRIRLRPPGITPWTRIGTLGPFRGRLGSPGWSPPWSSGSSWWSSGGSTSPARALRAARSGRSERSPRGAREPAALLGSPGLFVGRTGGRGGRATGGRVWAAVRRRPLCGLPGRRLRPDRGAPGAAGRWICCRWPCIAARSTSIRTTRWTAAPPRLRPAADAARDGEVLPSSEDDRGCDVPGQRDLQVECGAVHAPARSRRLHLRALRQVDRDVHDGMAEERLAVDRQLVDAPGRGSLDRVRNLVPELHHSGMPG